MASRRVKARVGDDTIQHETHSTLAYTSLDSDSEDSQPLRNERRRGFDMEQLEFCHHCLQLKQTQIHVRCRYQSSRQRVIYPAASHVNGVKIYNAEMHTPNMCDSLVLKSLVKDKKRRHNFEEVLDVRCPRQYCSFCLKNFYDINFASVRNDSNWNCPYCVGLCFCSRCRRQDQLTTVRGYLISLNLRELANNPLQADKVFTQAASNLITSNHPID